MIITWDENKRLANIKKHGLDFADAEKVLSGYTIVFEDTRLDYEEERWVAIGRLNILIVVIIHAETETELRIISMRKATKNEQEIYYNEYHS